MLRLSAHKSAHTFSFITTTLSRRLYIHLPVRSFSTDHGWTSRTLQEANNALLLKKFSRAPVTVYHHQKSGATLVHVDTKNDPNNLRFRFIKF
jgi:hypothetical protein